MDQKTQWKQQVNTLLGRVKRGDKTAFEALYETTQSRLFGLTCHVLIDQELAADAMQEAYLKIWMQASRHCNDHGCAWSWMCQLTRNQAIDLLRQHHRLARNSQAFKSEAESHTDVINEEQRWIDCRALEQTLSHIDEKQRETLLLAYVYGFSHQELMAKLQAPLGTLKSQIRRSLLFLRTQLSHSFPQYK